MEPDRFGTNVGGPVTSAVRLTSSDGSPVADDYGFSGIGTLLSHSSSSI